MSDLAQLIKPKKYYDEIGKIEIIKENDDELYARCPFHGKDRKRFDHSVTPQIEIRISKSEIRNKFEIGVPALRVDSND